MQPITFERLHNNFDLKLQDKGFIVAVQREWVVKGENRMSYTTALKLAECCREYHWTKDICSKSEVVLDSTVRNLSAEFRAPIFIGDEVSIIYSVPHIGTRSYILQVEIKKSDNFESAVIISLTNVFLDSDGESVEFSQVVRFSLSTLVPH
jgi:acyl-CoA thioesterase FadM